MRFGFDKVLRTQKHLLWFILVYFLVLSTECAKVKKGGVRSSLTHPHRNYKPVEVRPEKDIVKGKICIGTNGRMSVPSNRDHHYRNLKDRFTNCTYVDGNLELTWLQDENLDLSFLQYIREVTGYVLISHVDIRRIELPRLQIIRGRTLFKLNVRDEEFALLVTLSKMYTLELPSLRDVLIGSVGLFNNYNLCHVKTIDWKEIMTDSTAPYVYVYNFTSPERSCPRCSNKCEAGCWGEGEENCQKFSKVNCSPQCDQGRCFGSNPRECCHLFCAGGCTGPKQSDCIACRNFYDDGVCTQECPPMQVYDPTTYSWKPNPKGKYAYGATCVKNCPEHLLKDSGACVRSCPANKKAKDGECVSCDGPCPKTCPGDVLIHSGNINKFEECTIIEGYIHILENSFNGFQHVYTNYTFGERYPPMHPDKLEVFKTLKEITGYFNIQAYHKDFKNLSYFRNLEVIGGRTVYEYFATLYIVKTSLESLELNSLKTINSGTVAILENKDLCYAESINWEKIKKNHDHALMLSNNRDNKTCTDKGLVCDKQCTSDGCWGPGPTQCLYCAHFKYDNKCVENCSVLPGLYQASNRVCKICHEECGSTCHGPGAENCTTCKHLRDGNLCVSSCGAYKYAEEGLCKQCHPNCAGGCSGPKNTEGPGGCKFCDKSLINEHSINVCLNINESCPVGYYDDYFIDLPSHSTGQAVCRKCHQRCQECTAFGFHVEVCKKCTNYLKDEQCEDECPHGDFPDENLKKCIPCDPECRSCFGLGPDKCHACRNYRVYEDGVPNNNTFKCVSSCPPQFPYRSFPDNAHAYCSEKSTSLLLTSFSNSNMFVIIGGIIVGIVVVMTIILIFLYCYCRKMKDKEKALNMTLSLSAIEDNEPLRPTNVLPNVAKLRIIKESEIRRGDILGYGAFGTVHKGMWLPEGESNKIPVAIKFLKEDTGANTSKEFLEEAYIMATVDHPNLLQLLAVCMTSQMMLITQLMPLGCLLDFVRNNKAKIGSKHLLDWCTQIARGMAYLEDKRLVHRDLAARNVLVQTPNAVKITDFGLAKLLDINEEQYKAAGGKMPIKWLALECIQRKIFTHKSDVWAFGVTVWELLTFGEKPYDHLSAREVPKFLEDGGRLPHPPIAAIEVFCIMVKCWFPVPETRPCFDELADNFSKMSRDPGRYLTIPGDKYMRTQNYSQIPHDMKNLSSAVKNSWSQLELEAKEHTAPSIKSANGSNQFWPTSSHFSDGSSASQFQNTINQKLLQYSQGIDPTMTSIQSDSSQGTNDSTMFKKNGTDEFDAGKAQAHIGTLKLELPVDEDDYLMPSPQQSVTTSTYVDLIDNQVGVKTPDFFKNNIDNPEYLLGNNTPAQTIGLPVSTFATATNPNNPKEGSMFGNTKSIEEESDHEYYNDFDRLQRELQPLHRNNNGSLV